ncbi:hypothetical protein NCC49_001944 [Naganishia albida]|nr:hypothetical protein NCC49_001944 [Naganishia albida]
MNNLLDISSPARTTSDQSLIERYSQTPFADVPGRILLVFLNRSAAQVHGDRRYVVQVAIAVTNGAKTKQDYLKLAQSTFKEIGQKSSDDISFLLPKFPATTTDLHFDESTTWYRLADEMFLHFNEPPPVLGVQCRTLFEKPKRDPWEKMMEEILPKEILPILMPMLVALGMFFAFSLVK